MKKTLIGAMLLLGSMSFAQKSITTGELALKETEQMKTELQLTPVQIENVASINNGIATKNTAITTNANLTEAQKQEALKSNEEARQSMLKNVLTEEQYAKYTKVEMTPVQIEKKSIKSVERRSTKNVELKQN